MDYRRLLHPLPLVLICLFVAVAVADLVENLTEDSPPPPELAEGSVPRFEAFEPVIDLRLARGSTELEILPIPELVQKQWSAPRRSGVWARSPKAELGVELPSGGYRAFILECMPGKRHGAARGVRLSLNGADCGEVSLEPGWKRYRYTLPAGSSRAGSNRVVLSFPDRGETARTRREILVRRLGWFFNEHTDVEALDAARPVSLDLEKQRFTIRRSGTLEVPLILEEQTDALQMRYRFSFAVGRADLEVQKSQEEGTVSDVVLRELLQAGRRKAGRVRVPLHGRRGTYILRIGAELSEPGNRLLIWSLRLVEEGDPTRRPWAVGSGRNRGISGHPRWR
jgi:hypothetical protein